MGEVNIRQTRLGAKSWLWLKTAISSAEIQFKAK
jgi:hypothetical protein